MTNCISPENAIHMTGWHLCSHGNILREDFAIADVQSLDAPYWIAGGSHERTSSGMAASSTIWKISIDRM